MNFLLITLLFSTLTSAQDTLFKEQWGLQNSGQKVFRAESEIHREEITGIPGMDARRPSKTQIESLPKDKEVIVAVIDSGIDMNHPEFEGRLYKGVDFLNNEAMSDDTGHGTHVSGIIAANIDGKGIEGLTPPQVKILPLKVLSSKVNSFIFENKNRERRIVTDIFANAIIYAIESKVHVINMSLGWPQIINSPKVLKALDVAYERGITVVAASGNNNKDVPTWPCGHAAVICVGAMDVKGELTEFSNHGGKVDLVAPGEWIVSTTPRNLESRVLRIQGYDAKNGSSQAAPFVSAAVALMKLQNPEIGVDEIKARLYSTSYPLKKDSDGRFVRFGALSIRDALASSAKTIVSPLVKELVTVPVNSQGEFDFEVPLEILGNTPELISVEIRGIKSQVEVQGSKLKVSGKINDLLTDSEKRVEFITRYDGQVTKTPATLSFASEVQTEKLMSSLIPGVHPSQMMTIQGAIRGAKLTQVSVEDEASHDFHGYILDPDPKSSQVLVIRFRSNAGENAKVDRTILNDTRQLLTVFEKDVNLDGKNDLVYYGINGKQDHIYLYFTDLEGRELFGKNSRWEMPISTFEGLPLVAGEGNFSWLKMKTELGTLLVPYYHKEWLLPEEDNSKRLIDFEPNRPDQRLYYWEPQKKDEKIIARPRVIDSVDFKKKLRKDVQASPRESVRIERLLPQSTLERKMGSARHLVSVGEGGFNRRFFLLKVSEVGSSEVSSHVDGDAFLTGNNVLMTRSLEDFSRSENAFLMTLLSRSQARVKPLSSHSVNAAWNLETSNWSNPFFEVVASFEGENRKSLFFESRYHVYVYEQAGSGKPVSRKLPINRDSSIPGVNFSETLQSVVVKKSQEMHPGVAINSTWIYGDRLYTMLSTENEFIRPISLSVILPKNCVPLKTQYVKTLGVSAYALLCQGQNGVELSFLPLEVE